MPDNRALADQLMDEVMDALDADEEFVKLRCRQAIKIYPDCVDALSLLAELECPRPADFVPRMREVVEAGKRDLGPVVFADCIGEFWSISRTRPFMRAMALLAEGCLEWGTPRMVRESMCVHEAMLYLNPNDNQGIREILIGSYLRMKEYDDARGLLERYPQDWLATWEWARVLLAFVMHGEDRAKAALSRARKRSLGVERHLVRKGRRPKIAATHYVVGDDTEAASCALLLWDAWRAHPSALAWLRSLGDAEPSE